MISCLLLTASILAVLATVSALFAGRRLSYFVVPYFFTSWLTGELALHHFALQVVATLVFVSFGALQEWQGVVGLVLMHGSWIGLIKYQQRASTAGKIFEGALVDTLGEGYRNGLPKDLLFSTGEMSFLPALRPFKMRLPEVERVKNVSYGDHGKRNRLDVYRHRSHPERCPTLLQIHGGGWVIGEKEQQALPLMNLMAARGWVCVAPNYRLSPRATFPDHIIDVKRALAWIRQHGAEYGADPDFVIITGGSAGGHLAALAALTANDPEWQPGFDEVDTSVRACVPFYGVFDFFDREGVRGRHAMGPFLEKSVRKCSPVEHRERWEKASPLDQIHKDAPPFFVIQGTHDCLVFVEEARIFVKALRSVSRNPVVYAELPGAQHAFDIFHSVRARDAIQAVARFCEYVRAQAHDRS